MEDDFVTRVGGGGVGDSPVKSSAVGSGRGSGITGGDTSANINCQTEHHSRNRGGRPTSLLIPASIGIETGGAAAAVSPAVPPSYSSSSHHRIHNFVMPSPSPAGAKESALRSARMVSDAIEQQHQQYQQQQQHMQEGRAVRDVDFSPLPSPAATTPTGMRFGMAPMLTIDPGGECVPTELEKKRQKLERYRFVCSEVEHSFIYVAGEDAAKQEGLVRNANITHIINCAGPQCPNYLEYTGRFDFLRLNFYDHRTEDVAWFIYSAFDFIAAAKAKKGRVLIHCVQGVSRSCTLAIAWLMLTTSMDYEEAYQRVRKGRPICAPNTGFICSLLEWEKRRRQPPAAPLMYRTAWHVPNFPHDVVLKLCMHEEDRKHVRPSLAALDSRGCYVIVLPPAPPLQRPSRPTTPTPPPAELAVLEGNQAEVGSGETPKDPYRSVSPSGVVDGIDDDEMEDVCSIVAASAIKGIPSDLANGGDVCDMDTMPLPPQTQQQQQPRFMQHGAVLPRRETTANANEAATAGLLLPSAAIAVAPATAAATADAAPSAAHDSRLLPPKISAAPKTSALAPVPGSSAAAAAGEAARAAKTLEVGAAMVSGFRGSSLCVRQAAKGSVSGGAVAGGGGRAEEGSLGAAAKSVAAAAKGVEVYVWRGSKSSPQMLELAKQGARWLRDYEGWGSRTNALVVEEGSEPPELIRYLEQGENEERKPPVYGDLSAPSPPATAARNGPGSLFHHTLPSSYSAAGQLSRTPRNSHQPLPSPAEPPTLSPAGPSPSPGGEGLGFSPSPYGIGVSPAGRDIESRMGGVSPAGGEGMCGISPVGGGGLCGVSPAGGREMCGISPAGGDMCGIFLAGGGRMCTGDVSINMSSVSPAGSAAASPAALSLCIPGEVSGGGGDGGGGFARSGGATPRGRGGSGQLPTPGGMRRLPRCSVSSACEDVDEGDEYVLMGLRSAGAAEQPSASAIAHVRDEAAASSSRLGGGTVEAEGAARGVGAGVGLPQRREQQRSTPRLFELSDELGVGQGGSELLWSELAIFDDQDLLPQCCFLLVPPHGKSYLWVGEEFAAVHGQGTDSLQRIHTLAWEAAARESCNIIGTEDVERAVLLPGDGEQPEEWWHAFESGYT